MDSAPLSLDNAGMEASREAWDGSPPPPRPGSMVGRTGPSSVIGSDAGLAALSARGGCRKEKVQGQFPSQEYGVSS